MILKELRAHQWNAFRRHSMFERNMALKVFTYVMFGIFGLQFLSFGFLSHTILSKYGVYESVIDSFNYILLYLMLFDFSIKYMWKQSQSMQIVPYLTLPIKRSTLFNFLLTKEFTSIWNLYFFFMLIPLVFKAVPAYYGYSGIFVYILFFYLLCVGNSLLVNIANNLLNRSGWFLFLPIICVAAVIGITLIPGVNIEPIVVVCDFILEKNIFAWAVLLLLFAALWKINLSMMSNSVYMAMQGKRISESGSSFNLPFIDRLGLIGSFINMEIKMILRSKRLKSQMYGGIVFIVFYFYMISVPHFVNNFFNLLFFTMFILGWLGMIMGQFIFTAESSCFDGLMTKNLSMLDMLKGKYLFYVSYSILMLFVCMILVFTGKIGFLFLISVFFYTVGVLFFLMFQNAVYNKSFFDHSETGMFNWKGTSGNMLVVSMLGMFVPLIIIIIINAIFGLTAACYFMLVSGFIFTVTTKYWLTWTYKRFLKRKYKNMEGFRSN